MAISRAAACRSFAKASLRPASSASQLRIVLSGTPYRRATAQMEPDDSMAISTSARTFGGYFRPAGSPLPCFCNMPAWPPLCLPSVVLPSQSTAAGKTKLLRTFESQVEQTGRVSPASSRYGNAITALPPPHTLPRCSALPAPCGSRSSARCAASPPLAPPASRPDTASAKAVCTPGLRPRSSPSPARSRPPSRFSCPQARSSSRTRRFCSLVNSPPPVFLRVFFPRANQSAFLPRKIPVLCLSGANFRTLPLYHHHIAAQLVCVQPLFVAARPAPARRTAQTSSPGISVPTSRRCPCTRCRPCAAA